MMQVKVHAFRVYDITTDRHVVAPRKATLAFIRFTPAAMLVAGTGEHVDATEVDAEGRYPAR